MKRLIPLALICAGLACWNAARDNRYDPKNPDKAVVSGLVMECDSVPINGTVVKLILNGQTLRTDTSDDFGEFAFDRIDPGVYRIRAETRFFNPVEAYPESLWANTERDYSLTFHTYHFEDDPAGTACPYGFAPEDGAWQIVDDLSGPSVHSVPQVYRGENTDAAGVALALCEKNLENLFFKANFRVSAGSSGDWRAGVVFHYRDSDNYYLFQITQDTASFIKVKNDTIFIRSKRPLDFPAGTWSTISLRCKEDSTLCYINDIYQFLVLDSSLAQGRIGFRLSNGDLDSLTSVEFDDVTIYPDFPDSL